MAPSLRSGGRHRASAAVGAGLLLTGGLTYVAFVDPHNLNSVYPRCPFKMCTGWNCPACGGLRMAHDLLHGDLAAAFIDNAFLLIGIPAVALWMLLRRRRKKEPALPVPAAVTVAVLATAWTVVRNLPGFPLVPTVFTG